MVRLVSALLTIATPTMTNWLKTEMLIAVIGCFCRKYIDLQGITDISEMGVNPSSAEETCLAHWLKDHLRCKWSLRIGQPRVVHPETPTSSSGTAVQRKTVVTRILLQPDENVGRLDAVQQKIPSYIGLQVSLKCHKGGVRPYFHMSYNQPTNQL